MNEHINWVDYGKGIGIILVVYGHLLSSAYHGGVTIPEHFFALSDSIVYSFHMPLFFFLSGLFVEGSFRKRGARSYLFDKFSRIAYPYLIWSLLQVSVEVIFSDQTQMGAEVSDLLAIPYQPWGQFWFLYALFLMHIVYTIFNNFGKYSNILMFIAGCVLFFYPQRYGIVAIYGFSIHFIFFISGIIFRKYVMDFEKRDIHLWVIMLLSAIFGGSAYFVFEKLITPTRLADGSHPFYFLYLAILGMTLCIALSQYLSKRNGFQFLQTLGIYSLQIYLAHMLAGVGVRMILLHVFGIQNWIIHIIFGVSVALISPIILQKISDRIKFPYLFEFRRNYETAPN